MKAILALLVFTGIVFADESALEEFANGNHLFTAAVYKELLKVENGNFLVSPLSAETVLALTQEGTKGETAEEFTTSLKLPSTRDKTRAAFKSLLPKLKSSEESLKLLSANKIYVANKFSIKPDFQQVATSIYEAGIENVNFSEKQEAASIINKWVEGQTNEKIKDLIDPDSLEDVKVVLVNALYFSGKWVVPFETYATRKQKFYKTAKDTVEVDTMHTTDSFKYYESQELNAKFLELPYIGDSVSMTIVLPNEKEGLAALESKLEEVFKAPAYRHERVDVSLPKFTIETQIKFVPILKKLGLTKAFDSTKADLSGISGEPGDLYISDVIQKAFINVTEDGTEAAAATAVLPVPSSLPPPPDFYFEADHPFLFSIEVESVILFAGKVSKL